MPSCATFITLSLVFCVPIRRSFSSTVHSFRVHQHANNENKQQRSTLSAWRHLLKGSWRSYKYPNIHLYYKIGGKEDALADFKSLQPTNVFQPKDNVWHGDVGQRIVAVSVQDNYSNMITVVGKGRDHWRIKTVIEYVKRPEDAKHARKSRQWEQLDLFKSKRRH